MGTARSGLQTAYSSKKAATDSEQLPARGVDQSENNAGIKASPRSLPLWDVVDDAVFVMPNVARRRNIELANKRQHAPLATDLEGTDSRDTKSNAPMPSIESTVARSSKSVLQHVCDALAPGSGGHCALMWRCGYLDGWPNLLSHGSGHQPPHQISHHDAPDAPQVSATQ